MLDIRRRRFITLLGCATAWPLAGRAQQGERMRRVAFLHPYAENNPEVLARVVAFRQGLEALGWTENRNIQIEHRYSGGDLGQIQAYATELVRSLQSTLFSPAEDSYRATRQMPQGLDAQHSGFFDLDQCSVPSMSTCLGATIRDGVLKGGHRP